MLAPLPSQHSIPKPKGFRGAGRIKCATRIPLLQRRVRDNEIARFKRGLRYENKVIQHLDPQLSALGTFLREPCFRYRTGQRTRFCFPDALVLFNSYPFNLLIEIKTRHTYDAWWQLTKLYAPVVQKALNCELKLLEVTASYDPGIKLPDKTRVLERLTDILETNHPYNIYIVRH